jgi:hypothetical protein
VESVPIIVGMAGAALRGGEFQAALDALVRGDGVQRGRHQLYYEGQDVTAEFVAALERNGFVPMTVRQANVAAGERLPAFYLHDGLADFGYVRWEIFTPRSRRKLFHSEYRNPANDEWAVQINLASRTRIWADPARKERHDVAQAVAVAP